MSPVKSKSQRRWLHAAAARGEIKQSVVDEFEAATPKGKKLPEVVKRAKKRKR